MGLGLGDLLGESAPKIEGEAVKLMANAEALLANSGTRPGWEADFDRTMQRLDQTLRRAKQHKFEQVQGLIEASITRLKQDRAEKENGGSEFDLKQAA